MEKIKASQDKGALSHFSMCVRAFSPTVFLSVKQSACKLLALVHARRYAFVCVHAHRHLKAISSFRSNDV